MLRTGAIPQTGLQESPRASLLNHTPVGPEVGQGAWGQQLVLGQGRVKGIQRRPPSPCPLPHSTSSRKSAHIIVWAPLLKRKIPRALSRPSGSESLAGFGICILTGSPVPCQDLQAASEALGQLEPRFPDLYSGYNAIVSQGWL